MKPAPTCRQDPYLYDRLQDYVSRVQATQGEKLFYSEATMRKEAGRLGMECHDLRRIYAILSRRELKAVMPAAQADREVQLAGMRHVRFSTTKRYLYNRKLRHGLKRMDCTGEKQWIKNLTACWKVFCSFSIQTLKGFIMGVWHGLRKALQNKWYLTGIGITLVFSVICITEKAMVCRMIPETIPEWLQQGILSDAVGSAGDLSVSDRADGTKKL